MGPKLIRIQEKGKKLRICKKKLLQISILEIQFKYRKQKSIKKIVKTNNMSYNEKRIQQKKIK